MLESGRYYHIYNHAVGNDNIFRKDENFLFFLKKYIEYIDPVVDTFAYCLLPNHFHIAIRVKTKKELLELRTLPKFETLAKLSDQHFVSKQFSNFFSSYTQAFNKQQSRKGNLFQKPFKYKCIEDDVYFKKILHYIHFNPVHHGFVLDLRDWKYSSFESFFSEKISKVKREEVITWFKDTDSFYEFHKREIDNKMVLELE
ncbi:MAG: hypothetical protein IPO21_03925 [Bacteroidales bacterium]|nr:hypothetical protein [Bacteroidales bacterium]